MNFLDQVIDQVIMSTTLPKEIILLMVQSNKICYE
uniref:Uncharacterized protein n=1 Tax=Arundo donax TaxID=35708 RepID=A0A0A9CVJ1_ARUDO